MRTAAHLAWTKEPWTCPRCSVTMKRGGKPPHTKWCGTDYVALFWSKVDKTGSCWIFTGAKLKGGYGHFVHLGNHWQTHRLSWFLKNGDPSGFDVLHTCDVPACCNPDHLYLGTDKDNANDRVARGRILRGDQLHSAKLTDAQAREILSLKGQTAAKELSAKYGVGSGAINAIWRRETWTHLETTSRREGGT